MLQRNVEWILYIEYEIRLVLPDYNTLYCFPIYKQKINGYLNCFVINDIVGMFYLQYNCNVISFDRFNVFMILNRNDIIIYGR
ncbi:hypothetical protein Deiofobo_0267 [Pseudomonas phage Deifobo]|nr:hypothetical protein Deiofobo_0267 [Pseudomonas phage Deifobo]